jgi:AcrR family transcriptional regulator
MDLAGSVGFGGLTIGRLSRDLQMSKSGLFAHFRSKEALQLEVIDTAAERFTEEVVRPAFRAPAGEPRLRQLFENWLAWAGSREARGGCVFIQASVEFDDQSGVVRDRLVQFQRTWLDGLTEAARRAMSAGHFHERLDPEQFAFQLYSLMLGYHHAWRLMRDPRAEDRLRAAFEALVADARQEHLP